MEGGKKRAVMLNLFQHRQIEVNKPKSCRRKRDFQAPATLKQAQGDKKRPVVLNLFPLEANRLEIFKNELTNCTKKSRCIDSGELVRF